MKLKSNRDNETKEIEINVEMISKRNSTTMAVVTNTTREILQKKERKHTY